MAKIKSFPNNQDEYVGAESVMRWLHGRTSGVFGASGNAAVAPVLDAMAVTVSDGNGWIANNKGDGVVWWIDNEEETGSKLRVDLEQADPVLPRIDRIVVSWQTTNYVALPDVVILKGVPASSPVAPSLTNNSIMRQICLASISIPAGATAITAAMITDERLSSLCGLVTETVGIDTSTMQAQFEALLEHIQGELSDLEAGSGVELRKLVFTNTEVAASAFVETGTYAEYPYRAAVPLDCVVETMIPEIVFSLSDAVSGIFAPVAESYSGGVYLYAKNAPANNSIIPTIICWRGEA